jgi:hypothetical protein
MLQGRLRSVLRVYAAGIRLPEEIHAAPHGRGIVWLV